MPRTLGGRQIQGGFSGKKKEAKKNVSKELTPTFNAKKARKGVERDGGEEVVDVETYVEKYKKPIKRKKATEEGGEEGQKKKKKVPWTVPTSMRCHQCMKTEEEQGEMIWCQNVHCKLRFCNRCLWNRYELKLPSFQKKKGKKEEKEAESKKEEEKDKKESKEEESSSSDEDDYAPRPVFKCPVCERICNCHKCRKKLGLPAIGSAIYRIKDEISSQFNCMWDYLIYLRDKEEAKKKKEEEDDDDE